MKKVIQKVPIEFFHFNSKDDIEALLIFTDTNSCENEGRGVFFIHCIPLRFNIGEYIGKAGKHFFAISEAEFESL